MFVPSNNNTGVYRCKLCAQIKIYHVNYRNDDLICDACKDQMKAGISIESGRETNGLPSVDLLLETYYKRDIKISFSSGAEKFSRNYTAMMIPNKDNWLNEKIKDSENQLKSAGMKNISFKIMGGFSEMEEYEITSYMNRETTFLRYSSNAHIMIPMILINKSNYMFRTTWRGAAPLDIFILLISSLLTLGCIGMIIYSLYNAKYFGLIFTPMAILSGSLTYRIFKEVF